MRGEVEQTYGRPSADGTVTLHSKPLGERDKMLVFISSIIFSAGHFQRLLLLDYFLCGNTLVLST